MNKQLVDLTVIELKAAIFDRQQHITSLNKEIEILFSRLQELLSNINKTDDIEKESSELPPETKTPPVKKQIKK